MSDTEAYASEYEAHYRLITTTEAELYRWVASCRGKRCRAWATTHYTDEQARDAGLAHCREKHVRGPWR